MSRGPVGARTRPWKVIVLCDAQALQPLHGPGCVARKRIEGIARAPQILDGHTLRLKREASEPAYCRPLVTLGVAGAEH